jgi:predicted N-acetyltransferase YhbS
MQILVRKFEGPRTLKAAEVPALMALFDDIFWKGKKGTMMHYLPQLYRDLDTRLETTQVITCRGEIASHLGLYPIEFAVENRRVRAGGIGGVLTQPKYRGQGLMGILLNRATALMKQKGVPLSILWGDRFRYSHFGWEPGGRKFRLGFSKKSLAYLKRFDAPIQEVQDPATLKGELFRMHEHFPVRAVRSPERFLTHLSSQGRRVFVSPSARKPSAYAVVKSWNDKGKIGWEIDEYGGSRSGVLSLFTGLLKKSGTESVYSEAPFHHTPYLEDLLTAADAWMGGCGHVAQWKIVDLPGLMSALGQPGLERPVKDLKLSTANLVSLVLGPAGPHPLSPAGSARERLARELPANLYLWPTDHV